jgi:CheY-like chemotaxis protein
MAKVLIVDDNHDAADTLSRLLAEWGFTTATAYEGQSALELAGCFGPDIVLLDLGMPGLSGVDVARRFHGIAGRRPRLIAISGYGRTEDEVQPHLAGFECHLLKPVALDTLKMVLEQYCPKTEPQA